MADPASLLDAQVPDASGDSLDAMLPADPPTAVTFTPTAELGWHFARWVVMGSGGSSIETARPLVLTVARDTMVLAVFEEYDLVLERAVPNFAAAATAGVAILLEGEYDVLVNTPPLNAEVYFTLERGVLDPAVDTAGAVTSVSADVIGAETPSRAAGVFDVYVSALDGAVRLFSNPVAFTFGTSGEPQPYALTVTSSGLGAVDPGPGVFWYEDGAEVEVVASPGPGWLFDRWEGDLNGADPAGTVVMDQHRSVHGVFVPEGDWTGDLDGPWWEVYVESTEGGEVYPDWTQYPTGTSVTITAEALPGWVFSHWEGDQIHGSTNPVETIVVGFHTVLRAVFEPLYFVFFECGSVLGGTITYEPVQAEGYRYSTPITFTATPEDDWEFDHWAGDLAEMAQGSAQGGALGGGAGAVRSITVCVDRSIYAHAVFKRQRHALTHQAQPSQGGSVHIDPRSSPGGSGYTTGTWIQAMGLEKEGYVFDRWENGQGTTLSEENPYHFQMPSDDMTVKGVFVPKPPATYTLHVSSEGSGTVTPSPGDHTYDEDEVVELTATPAEDWAFDGWDGDVSGRQRTRTVRMDRDKFVRVRFVELPGPEDLVEIQVFRMNDLWPGHPPEHWDRIPVAWSPEPVLQLEDNQRAFFPPGTVISGSAPEDITWLAALEGYEPSNTCIHGRGSCTIPLQYRPSLVALNQVTDRHFDYYCVNEVRDDDCEYYGEFALDVQGRGRAVQVTNCVPFTSLTPWTPYKYLSSLYFHFSYSEAPGWHFVRWEDGNGQEFEGFDGIVETREELDALNGGTIVFEPDPVSPPESFTLILGKEGSGAVGYVGELSSGGAGTSQHYEDDIVTVVAAPASGWIFKGWVDQADPSEFVSTNEIYGFRMRCDRDLKARFERYCTLWTYVKGAGLISRVWPKNAAKYLDGEVVILAASASPGWEFDHWERDCTGDIPLAGVTMSGDEKKVTAVFHQIPLSGNLESVTFTSDHGVLQNEEVTFAGVGQPYGQPEWTSAGNNHPISQTRGTQVFANVTLTVNPPELPFKLVGDAAETCLKFTGYATAKGQTQVVLVRGEAELPNVITSLSESIAWRIVAEDNPANQATLGRTGPHEVFVTWGTPHAETYPQWELTHTSVATYKRMERLVAIWCNGVATTRDLADKVGNKAHKDTAFGNWTQLYTVWDAMDSSCTLPLDCYGGAMLAVECLDILGVGLLDREFVTAYPSKDRGTKEYRSDCSCPEYKGYNPGKGLQLRFQYSAGGFWYLAENGFRVRGNAGHTWVYMTVHDPYGPFWGSTGDEEINKKQALYKIMDKQRDDHTGYLQKWGWGQYSAPPLP